MMIGMRNGDRSAFSEGDHDKRSLEKTTKQGTTLNEPHREPVGSVGKPHPNLAEKN